MGTKIQLFERHRNGATIDVKGPPEEAAKILLDWRAYQDGITTQKPQLGFRQEEKTNGSV